MNSSLGVLCSKHSLVASLTLDQVVRFAAFFVKCSKQDGGAPFQESRWESFAQELSENVSVHLSSDACKNLVKILQSNCPNVFQFFQSPLFNEIEYTMHLNLVELSDETVTCLLSYLHLPELACVTGVAKSWNSRFRNVLNHKPFVILCARQGFTYTYRPLCWNFLLKVYKQSSSLFLSFQTEESISKRKGNSNNSNSDSSSNNNSEFVSAKELEISSSTSQEKTILNDVVRTLPEEESLHTKRCEKMIFDLINTYVLSDPDVGYCQPMSLLAAIVVAVVEQAPPRKNENGEDVPRSLLAATEQAFALYSALMRGKDLRSMFKLHLPLLSLCLFQLDALIKKYLPTIYTHFEKQQMDTFSYATEWYLTMFAGVLPVSVVLRLWDLFLCDGWIVFHQFVLNFLSMQQDTLLASVGYDCIRQMQKALTKVGTQLSDSPEPHAKNERDISQQRGGASSSLKEDGAGVTPPITTTLSSSSFTPTISPPSPRSYSFDPTSRSAFTPLDTNEDFKPRNSDIFFEPLSLACSSSTTSISLPVPPSSHYINNPVLHSSTNRFVTSREVNPAGFARENDFEAIALPDPLTLASQVPPLSPFPPSPTSSEEKTPLASSSSAAASSSSSLSSFSSLSVSSAPLVHTTTNAVMFHVASSSSPSNLCASSSSSLTTTTTTEIPLSGLASSALTSASSVPLSMFSPHICSSSSSSSSSSLPSFSSSSPLSSTTASPPSPLSHTPSPSTSLTSSSLTSSSLTSSSLTSSSLTSSSLTSSSLTSSSLTSSSLTSSSTSTTTPTTTSSSPSSSSVSPPLPLVPSLSSSSEAVRETWSALLNDSFGLTKQFLAQLESEYSMVVARRQQRAQEGGETPRPEPAVEIEQPDAAGETMAHLWGFQKLDTNFFSSSSRSNSVPSIPDTTTHVATAKEGMSMLLRAVAPSQLKKDWEFLEQKDNVHIWRRRIEETPEAKMDGISSISCKGVGIIARATPLDLLKLLQDAVLTGRYASIDDMCTNCTVVECISKSAYVIHKTFRLWRWCQAASRDFCAVSQVRSLPDGTCVWVARSVKHPKCPLTKGTIRSTVNFEGWVFKPIYANSQTTCSHISRTGPSPTRPTEEGSEKASKRCSQCPPPNVLGTEATYVIDIELLASVPSMFINKINLQRPLLINDLAVYFNTRSAARRTEVSIASPTQLRSPAASISKPSKPSSLTKMFSRPD